MIVIAGVPGREEQRDKSGKVLQGAARTPGLNILPSWLMAQARDEINSLAQSRRALSQGNLAPNHYWDHAANKVDKAAVIEQMERESTYIRSRRGNGIAIPIPARAATASSVTTTMPSGSLKSRASAA